MKNINIAVAVRTFAILGLVLIIALPSFAGVVSAAPASPSNLTATVSGGGQVSLRWTDNSSDESGFLIERATDDIFVNFKTSFTVPANINTFTDNTVAATTLYYYRVSAISAAGNSPPSNTVTATTPAKLAFPKGPLDLTGKVESDSMVSLKWKDQSDNEEGFRIERAADELFSREFKTFQVKAGVISYIDSTLEALQTYYYRVIAWNAAGDSPASDVVSVTTLDKVPEAPSDLDVQFVSNREVRLRWSDNSGNETGFQIQRATDNAFSRDLTLFTVEANAGSGAPITVTDRQAPTGAFVYRVRAYNDSGDSTYSNIAHVTVSDQANQDLPLFGSDTAFLSYPGFNLTSATSVKIDRLGQFLGSNIVLNSLDNKVRLEIPGGIHMYNATGHALTRISYYVPDILPEPPEKKSIVEAFNFGPNGATFSSKATLYLRYDPADFPQEVTWDELTVISWNGSDWQTLGDLQLKPDQLTVIATTTHTGLVAIVGPKPDLSAKFTVSNLYIYPQSATVGNSVLISLTVTNIGYSSGYYDVVLKLNGVLEDSQQVNLDAGEKTDVKFTCANKPIKDYTVDINGTAGVFSIRAAPLNSPSPTVTPTSAPTVIPTYSPVPVPEKSSQFPVMVVVLVAALVIVLLVVFFLLRR